MESPRHSRSAASRRSACRDRGFVAEFLTFVGACASAHSCGCIPRFIGAFLTSIYGCAWYCRFLGPASPDPHFHNLPDAQGTEWVALVFLVGLLVLFGVVPSLIVGPIDTATVPLLRGMGIQP